VEVQKSPIECENSCRSQRDIWKFKSHEGSPRVIREVNNHPIYYIYTLKAQEKDFSPCLLQTGIREEDSSFGEQVVTLTLHY